MNVKLLRKVAKHILAEPTRLVMGNWLLKKGYEDIEAIEYGEFGSRPFPKCGTAGCIAGWTCELSGKGKVKHHDLVAKRLLGLNKRESERLFLPDQWPAEFERGYNDDGRKKTAEVAVARIEHFIKTKGKE